MPRLAIVMILTISITLIIVYRKNIIEGLDKFCNWMQDHIELGPFLLAISFVLLTPLLIPATLVIVPTGLIMQRVFQKKWKAILIGSLTSFLGLWIGSLISFLIGRYIMRDLTQRLNKNYKIMKALD